MNNSLSPKDRTTAIGLFNFARSYWRSSEQLRASKPDVSHPEAPIVFLFYHAIELYLKAYVRSAGYNLQQLKDISHNITKAGRAAQKDGLQLSNDDFELLAVIDSHDNVVRTRYKTTGAYTYPTAPKALTGTLSSSESARNPNNPRPSALKLSSLVLMLASYWNCLAGRERLHKYMLELERGQLYLRRGARVRGERVAGSSRTSCR
jgi:hypothetical protein